MVINELGQNQKYNTIFDTLYTGTFDGASQEIAVGLDRTRESLIRATAIDADSGSEFSLIADDQYSIRQNKIGYFGSMEEGRIILDTRALVGKIV